MTTSQLHDPQRSYSQPLHFNHYQHVSQVYYCQENILSGSTYVGMTPTMEHDQLYPNILYQPFYNLHRIHNNRNTTNYCWSHAMQESSRIFKIGPILTKIEPLKEFLFL